MQALQRGCVKTLLYSMYVSPHAEHIPHSWAAVGLRHGNTNGALFTPLYEAGKHGNERKNVCERE